METPSCKWAAGRRPLGQFSGHKDVRPTHTGVSARGWAVQLRAEVRTGRLGALLSSRPWDWSGAGASWGCYAIAPSSGQNAGHGGEEPGGVSLRELQVRHGQVMQAHSKLAAGQTLNGQGRHSSACLHGSLVKNSQCRRGQGCYKDMPWIRNNAQLRGEGAPIKATPCSLCRRECKPTLGPSRRERLVHLPHPRLGSSQSPALTQPSPPPFPQLPLPCASPPPGP